jgi:Helix-turn-helix domain
MAGRSRYQIVLSGEERAELEHRAACYSRPHREVQRAKLVLFAADGLSNVEIARRLGMTPELVGRWRKRFHAERLDGLSDRKRAGRPRRFPPGRGRTGQGDRVRAARDAWAAAVALQPV